MNGNSELNERQELFCRYYVRRPVGAEAVRSAGYEPLGAAVQACRLLDRRDVRARIAALRADVARQHCRDEDTILAKLESVYAHAIEDRQYHAAARADLAGQDRRAIANRGRCPIACAGRDVKKC